MRNGEGDGEAVAVTPRSRMTRSVEPGQDHDGQYARVRGSEFYVDIKKLSK